MLCAHCSTPLRFASSVCPTCGARSGERSYSLALSSVDRFADTQPEMATIRQITGGHSREDFTQAVASGRSAAPMGASRSAAEPYTLTRLLGDTFGRNASSHEVAPHTRLQGILLRAVGAPLAVTKWVPALFGALLATGLGLLAMLPLYGAQRALVLSATQPGGPDSPMAFGATVMQALLSGNLLQTFVLAHGVSLTLVRDHSADWLGTTMQLRMPLTALALIPLAALVAGGALASASDFARDGRASLARGALIGPFYGLLLMLLALLSKSVVDGGVAGLSGTAILLPSPVEALTSGLALGTICGAAGGWLHLYGARSLVVARVALESAPVARAVGVLGGAMVALVWGLGVCLSLVLAGIAYIAVHGPTPELTALMARTGLASAANTTGDTLALLLALAPGLALGLWSFAHGAPITTDRISYAGHGTFQSDFASLALPHNANWPLLLILIPLTAYLVGGRVAARFIGARRPIGAILTGAAIALPLALATYLLVSQSALGVDVKLPTGMLILDATPSASQAALLVFLSAAFVGGLGGYSTLLPPRFHLPHLMIRRPRQRFFALLHTLTGHRHLPITAARRWLYDAALVACALSVTVLALDLLTVFHVVTSIFGADSATSITLTGLAVGALVAAPLLCLCMSMRAALAATFLPRPDLFTPPESTAPNAADTQPVATPPAR